MKVTMLYFHTISKLIKKYGYSWNDVENIQDHNARVRRFYTWNGQEHNYAKPLERAFYCTHIGRTFDENGERERVLIEAFLEALEEARQANKAVSV